MGRLAAKKVSQAFQLLADSTTWQPSNFYSNTLLKGKLGKFFYWLKVFIGPKLREVSIDNFHRKAPKWAKNQVKVSKNDQIRPLLHPTYCGNPPNLSSELLWESTKSGIGAAVGIHFLAISASDLLWESTKSVIGAAVGIHQFLHRSYCGNPYEQTGVLCQKFKVFSDAQLLLH